MGRRTRSTIPLSEQLLQPEIADPPTVSSEINRRKIASKAQYDKHAQALGEPLDLWANHQQYSSPLLQHRNRQFHTPPHPGSIASSCPT